MSHVATELQVAGGGTTWASRAPLLDFHVASTDMAKATGHGLARKVRFTRAPRVVDVPAGVLKGLPTRGSTGVLQALRRLFSANADGHRTL